ncbi:MAG: hypothetical protein JW883_14840 [Deltaproteobacteria bacterium]|nr:hypothetical protein [Deltaproteobacteria bacterium]
MRSIQACSMPLPDFIQTLAWVLTTFWIDRTSISEGKIEVDTRILFDQFSYIVRAKFFSPVGVHGVV